MAEAREDILQRLNELIPTIYKDDFFLSPFGSSVNKFSSETSDFDLVLLLPGKGADEKGNNVRQNVVLPLLRNISNVLSRKNFKLKEFIRTARVPIVALECNAHKIPADVSVNQPFGLLNSWLLRDYAQESVVTMVNMVKKWAKSKGLSNARDGYFSSYGWTLLSLAFLMEEDIIPNFYIGNAVEENPNPFFDCQEALTVAIDAVTQDQKEPRPFIWFPYEFPAFETNEDLLKRWLEYVHDHLNQDALEVRSRKLVSIREPGLNNWDELLKHTKKPDHWQKPVYAVIEEPFSGENVGRVLRVNGHRDTQKELKRALEELEKGSTWDELVAMPKLTPPPVVRTAGIKRPLTAPMAPAAMRARFNPQGAYPAAASNLPIHAPGRAFGGLGVQAPQHHMQQGIPVRRIQVRPPAGAQPAGIPARYVVAPRGIPAGGTPLHQQGPYNPAAGRQQMYNARRPF